MGNQQACLFSPHPICRSSSIRIITSEGKLELYKPPLRAGDLMVNNPGQFICHPGHLHVGHRVPGLPADEELEGSHHYFLLPMDMLYSVLTEEEMVLLFCKASSAMATKAGLRSSKSSRRIIPELGRSERCSAERIEYHGEKVLRRKYSWKPALDTIEEDPAACMVVIDSC